MASATPFILDADIRVRARTRQPRKAIRERRYRFSDCRYRRVHEQDERDTLFSRYCRYTHLAVVSRSVEGMLFSKEKR
jgi:hypothetical protein